MAVRRLLESPWYMPCSCVCDGLPNTRKFISLGMLPATIQSCMAAQPVAMAEPLFHGRLTEKTVTWLGAANVRNLNVLTMPKLEPEPRMAQKRSGLTVSEASTTVALARTTVALWIQSTARPCVCELKPKPPCREWPATPTLFVMLVTTTSQRQGGEGDKPGAGAVAKSALAVTVQQGSDVAQTSAGLDGGDVGRRVERDGVHAVELDDEMAVLSAEAERGIAVAARLGRDLEADLGAARDGGGDLLRGRGHGDGGGGVLEALIEGVDIVLPAGRVAGVDGDLGCAEAVVDGSALVEPRVGGDEGGRGQRESSLEPHGDGCRGSASERMARPSGNQAREVLGGCPTGRKLEKRETSSGRAPRPLIYLLPPAGQLGDGRRVSLARTLPQVPSDHIAKRRSGDTAASCREQLILARRRAVRVVASEVAQAGGMCDEGRKGRGSQEAKKPSFSPHAVA